MAQKNSDINGVNSADHELYLECLGQLVGITFKPGTNLRETERVSQQQFDLAKAESDTYVASNISIEKAKQWKPGALTACLRRLGIDPDGKKVTCSDPLKPTAKEILPSFVFPHTEVSHCEDICSTSGFKRKRDVFSGKQNENCMILGNKKRIEGNPKNPNDASNHFQNRKLFSSITAPPVFTQNSNLNQGQHYSNKKSTSADTANAIPDEDMEGVENVPNSFQTARTVLMIQDKEKGVNRSLQSDGRKRGGLYKSDIIKARKTFVENVQKSESKTINHERQEKGLDGETNQNDADPELVELLSHPQMKNFEVKIVESIWSEVMQPPQVTNWSDIAGLEGPKRIINEIIIWPMLRPEIFHGLRAPAKGILLFGPPGTGKTMIGRVIASVSKSTFFNISASSLTSKWIGEGEKLVRCLFQLARLKQPSVVFIDEIDSILTSRSDTEHESSRRIKTEFLVQFDGCGTTSEDRVLVIGVTNRPQELDEAARRRLVKRIYIPLPDIQGRIQMVKNLMAGQQSSLTEEDYKVVGEKSQGFSGADMKSLCQDASYGPIREIMDELETITPDRVRGIEVKDFLQAFKQVKSSVADTDLVLYEEWDSRFGSHAGDR